MTATRWSAERARLTSAAMFVAAGEMIWLAAVWTFGGDTITIRTNLFGEHDAEIVMFLGLASVLLYTAMLWVMVWRGERGPMPA